MADDESSPSFLPWLLRTGEALCFIGRGAFGLLIERGGSAIVPLALAYLLARPTAPVPLPAPQLSGSI